MINRKETGDYYRNIISVLRKNLESLENDRIRYGRFRRIISGIDKNIENRRRQLFYYENQLLEYINNGYAE